MALPNIPGPSNPSASVTKFGVTNTSGPGSSGGGGGGGGGSGTVTQVNTGTGLTGGPINTTGTVAIANTGVSAGTVGNSTRVPRITVNAQGQITALSAVLISAGTVTSVAVGAGLTASPSPITGSGTITAKLATATTQGDVIVSTSGRLLVDGAGNISVPLSALGTFGVVQPDNTTTEVITGIMTVLDNGISNGKLAKAPTLTLKGNNTGGTANETDLTVSQVNTMLGTLTNPMTNPGDLIDGGTAGAPTRLAVMSSGTLSRRLTQSISGGSFVSNTWGPLPEVYLSEYGTLAAADSVATSIGGVVVIDVGLTISSNTTVVSPVRMANNKFTINSGIVLYLSGGVIASPVQQIFTSTGTVKLNANTPYAYPEWWGATHSSSGDDGPFINAGLTACYQGATIWVSGTSYTSGVSVVKDPSNDLYYTCILSTSGTTQPHSDGTHWSFVAVQAATFCFGNFNYYLKTTIAVVNPVPIVSMPGAFIHPSSSSPATNAMVFGTATLATNFNYYGMDIGLPGIGASGGSNGFTGIGLHIYCCVGYFKSPLIVGNGEGIRFTGTATANCLDNTVYVQFLPGNTTSAIVMNPDGTGVATIQGNRVTANFINGGGGWVKYVATNSATANPNDNAYFADAVDMDNGSGVILINNTMGGQIAQEVFSCSGFFGGLLSGPLWVTSLAYTTGLEVIDPTNLSVYICISNVSGSTQPHSDATHWTLVGAAALVLQGYYDQCSFNFGTGSGFILAYFQFGMTVPSQPNNGAGNQYISGYGQRVIHFNTVNAVAAVTSPGSLTSFNTNTLGPSYPSGLAVPITSNRVPITMTLASGLAVGAFQAFYVYHPFVDGSARLSFGAQGTAANSGGFIIEDSSGNVALVTQLFDHTSSNPYEIKIGLRGIGPSTVAAGTTIFGTLLVGT